MDCTYRGGESKEVGVQGASICVQATTPSIQGASIPVCATGDTGSYTLQD